MLSDVKQYLNQVRYSNQDINSRQKELDDLRRNIPSASNWKTDPVQETHTNGSFVDKLVKLDDEISNKIDRLIEAKRTISNQIDQLEVKEHHIVLRERYLNQRSYEYIADVMYTSDRNVKRIHGRALEEFRTKFQQEIDSFIKSCP